MFINVYANATIHEGTLSLHSAMALGNLPGLPGPSLVRG